MMISGYGRGGRGAALLQALDEQNDRPGMQIKKCDQQQAHCETPTLESQPFLPSLGRGACLSSFLQSGKTQSAPMDIKAFTSSGNISEELQAQKLPVMPMGRGLSAMQALLQAASKGTALSPGSFPSVGRGGQPTCIGKGKMMSASTSPPPLLLEEQAETSPAESPPPAEGIQQLSLLDGKSAECTTGSEGKKVNLAANYIRVKCRNEAVYQYHVSFTPQIDSKNMRYKMIQEQVEVLGTIRAFDGAILYLPIKLPQQETALISKRFTDGASISVCIKLVKTLKPESCVQLYNIIFRRIMNILQMCQVGRYYYNPSTPTSVPQHKLEIWPGYITAIKEHEGGLLLLADASHKVLRKETVLDILVALAKKNPSSFHDNGMKAVVGSIVLTRYNNKTYRIDDIAWDKNPQDAFISSSSGQSTTFVEYYRKNYNKEIRDWEQPLLLHRPKKKQLFGVQTPVKSEMICLIPELCYMTGLTDEMRQDFRVMKDIASHTRVTPMQRQLTLKKFVEAVNQNTEARKQLENWGLELAEEMLSVSGRFIHSEKILMRDWSFGGNIDADWSKDVTKAAVITPVSLDYWIIVYTKRDQSKTKDFVQMMMKVTAPMGIHVSLPRLIEVRDDKTETVVRILRENINPQVQMVVVVCPFSRDDKYSAIKKLCCVECPVPSQVIIGKTISQSKKLRSVTQKIALQINCKLGGELWALEIPLQKVMVVGIDVYHDAAKGKRSIGAFVASTNKHLTRWYSRVCFQMPHQELIDGLKMCFIASLRKFHEINHFLPEKVMVYRDGVSDSQLSVVSGYEVQQLAQCFTHFGEGYQPRLSVVVVQKRINTRIFTSYRGHMDNPPPGTVVDQTITQRHLYDYFLISQHVRQGTVSPTHYIVVHDDSELSPDRMQKLTYKMTHLYYNWPGTIRVPAPCQYAHKLAYLIGQNIHREPSQQLSDRLFFL